MVFRTNRDRLADFPNLWNYAKDLYQTPGFGATTDFDAIKRGYQSIPPLGVENNAGQGPYRIISAGPDQSVWFDRHDREKFAS